MLDILLVIHYSLLKVHNSHTHPHPHTVHVLSPVTSPTVRTGMFVREGEDIGVGNILGGSAVEKERNI